MVRTSFHYLQLIFRISISLSPALLEKGMAKERARSPAREMAVLVILPLSALHVLIKAKRFRND